MNLYEVKKKTEQCGKKEVREIGEPSFEDKICNNQCNTMRRLVPVKFIPDQYCGQIRDTKRNRKAVKITRLQERMEYVKVKKENSSSMSEVVSNYGAKINYETVCGPDLSTENNNLVPSTESYQSPSEFAECFATNESGDLLENEGSVPTEQRAEGPQSRVEVELSIDMNNETMKPYKCKDCDKSFCFNNSLLRHVRYMHTHEKRFKCKDCDYVCVESSKFKRHMRIHSGERPYPCQHCSYTSPDTFSLKRHMRIHTGEMPYVCTECQAKFSQQNSLKNHRKVHTDHNPSYQCESCPVALGSKWTLYKHVQNLHTSEEPIPCKLCGKTFQDKYTMKVHKKTHKGTRCFDCPLCPYRCFTERRLRSHMLIHSGQKHVSLHELENSKKYIKIKKDRRGVANSGINSPQVDVPDERIMDKEVELDVVCDVIELPEDGVHGGVQIAVGAEDHQLTMKQDENGLQYYHVGHQQSDSHANQGDRGLRKRWDMSNCFGFGSDSE